MVLELVIDIRNSKTKLVEMVLVIEIRVKEPSRPGVQSAQERTPSPSATEITVPTARPKPSASSIYLCRFSVSH